MRRAALMGAREQAAILNRVNVEVTGHSLGAALATLYVATNASDRQLHVSRVYTFASPLVGDTEFVATFDRLDVESWRIADPYDVVTVLPLLGFRHVNNLVEANPGDRVNRTVECLHSMDTYLYLVHAGLSSSRELRVVAKRSRSECRRPRTLEYTQSRSFSKHHTGTCSHHGASRNGGSDQVHCGVIFAHSIH